MSFFWGLDGYFDLSDGPLVYSSWLLDAFLSVWELSGAALASPRDVCFDSVSLLSVAPPTTPPISSTSFCLRFLLLVSLSS